MCGLVGYWGKGGAEKSIAQKMALLSLGCVNVSDMARHKLTIWLKFDENKK